MRADHAEERHEQEEEAGQRGKGKKKVLA